MPVSQAGDYDAWNRLVEIDSYSGNADMTAEYDGLNRRIVRISGGETRHFYYNQQWQVLEERVGTSSTANKQFVYHPHYVDAITLRRDASGTNHYYLQDANFNVTAVVDNTGTVKERYAYTPYGEVTILDLNFSAVSGNVSTISNEHLYTGRRQDPGAPGLQLNRNRFYASGLGRWVNRDPIGYEGGGMNVYEYVNGMPLISFDPFGEVGLTCEQQDHKNGRDFVDCWNGIDDDFRDFYRACRGFDGGGGNGSREECGNKWKKESDRRLDQCREDFPDLDCDDTCTFDPGACFPEAAAVAATAAACTACTILKKNPALCPACYNLPAAQQKYNECVKTKGTKTR